MTTNLFVIVNVKQLQTGGSFRILLSFFRTSCGVGILNSAIFNSFHNWVEFSKIMGGGAFGISGGGLYTQTPPLSVRDCQSTTGHISVWDHHIIPDVSVGTVASQVFSVII